MNSPNILLQVFLVFGLNNIEFPLNAIRVEQRLIEKLRESIESLLKTIRVAFEVIICVVLISVSIRISGIFAEKRRKVILERMFLSSQKEHVLKKMRKSLTLSDNGGKLPLVGPKRIRFLCLLLQRFWLLFGQILWRNWSCFRATNENRSWDRKNSFAFTLSMRKSGAFLRRLTY